MLDFHVIAELLKLTRVRFVDAFSFGMSTQIISTLLKYFLTYRHRVIK